LDTEEMMDFAEKQEKTVLTALASCVILLETTENKE